MPAGDHCTERQDTEVGCFLCGRGIAAEHEKQKASPHDGGTPSYQPLQTAGAKSGDNAMLMFGTEVAYFRDNCFSGQGSKICQCVPL